MILLLQPNYLILQVIIFPFTLLIFLASLNLFLFLLRNKHLRLENLYLLYKVNLLKLKGLILVYQLLNLDSFLVVIWTENLDWIFRSCWTGVDYPGFLLQRGDFEGQFWDGGLLGFYLDIEYLYLSLFCYQFIKDLAIFFNFNCFLNVLLMLNFGINWFLCVPMQIVLVFDRRDNFHIIEWGFGRRVTNVKLLFICFAELLFQILNPFLKYFCSVFMLVFQLIYYVLLCYHFFWLQVALWDIKSLGIDEHLELFG